MRAGMGVGAGGIGGGGGGGGSVGGSNGGGGGGGDESKIWEEEDITIQYDLIDMSPIHLFLRFELDCVRAYP